MKIVEINKLAVLGDTCRRNGKKVVLANGCFDLLHVGHVRYLTSARELGDVLVVAINSDSSVSALKGHGRPFINENERAEILSAFACVDHIVIFSDPNVENIIRSLRPDFQAKGTDYTEDTVPERDVVKEVGGRVAIVGDPKDHSSTEMLTRISLA